MIRAICGCGVVIGDYPTMAEAKAAIAADRERQNRAARSSACVGATYIDMDDPNRCQECGLDLSVPGTIRYAERYAARKDGDEVVYDVTTLHLVLNCGQCGAVLEHPGPVVPS